jgi:tetratricopeptide (TPR) repeat protein
MKTIKLKRIVSILMLTLLIPVFGFSQTAREAVEEYNIGAGLIKDDPGKALEHLYRALEISEELDFEGKEYKELAESLIPRAHFQLGMSLGKANKPLEALKQFEKAKETAEKYFDKNTLGRVEKIIPQLYNRMGNTDFRAANYEKAISDYKKAIEIKDDYPDPYLGISLSYEKMEDYEKMIEYLKKTLDIALKVNDRAKAEDAQRKAKGYLLRNGDAAQQAKKHEEAIGWFEKVIDFDSTDGAIYFILAVNHGELKNWDKVIEYGKLALENANGLDEAGVYYQMGVAYTNLGNNAEACSSFKNAQTGSFRQAAEYQINEVLKCN